MTLEVNDFICSAQMQHDHLGKIRGSCSCFSYKFTSGIYFITGEFDVGAWAFAYSLAEHADTYVNCKSIILNGNPVELADVRMEAFHVGQYAHYGKESFASVIAKAARESGYMYPYNEMFKNLGWADVNEETARWRMDCVNSKIWYISPLIGLTLKKRIFVFPWLSKINYTSCYFQTAFDYLIEEDVIVLVPCSEKIQFPTGDKYNVVRMASLLDLFIQQGIDFEKDHH